MTGKRKLIEVALPLEAINAASAREKSIRHGHPSTLHLWWARRPLAACRAVLFSQLVDDPSAHPDRFPTEEAQQAERERLFRIIEDLVLWENVTNERVLEAARTEIRRSCNGDLPPILDPFSGGGSIPLEAQRLGLDAHAGDLNPVAVLINKALIEIPPRFADRTPVNPDANHGLGSWSGAQGLADDVRWYGNWMSDQAQQRIGHLYPKVALPREHGGGQATVIAWLWARTVTCPNPACGAEMPLVRSFWLSKKKGKAAWVEPVIDRTARTVRFEVGTAGGEAPGSTVERTGARCLVCESPVPLAHVRAEGKAGRMGAQLMAIAAEGHRGRVYLAPRAEHEHVAQEATPTWRPDGQIAHDPRAITTPNYGMTHFADLFTERQLVALTTFSDLVADARDLARKHATEAGMVDDGVPLADDGTGTTAYADAVATYLAFAVDRVAEKLSTIATWDSNGTKQHVRGTFARQALSMTWDFGEGNPFYPSAGAWAPSLDFVAKVIANSPPPAPGSARQVDATTSVNGVHQPVISTDPPYYDNIGYADLSDFFYVWLRHALGDAFPALFSTLLTPKSTELVANPYRFDGSRTEAEHFFEDGLRKSFAAMRAAHNPDAPMTVFYAFKQAESNDARTSSTGWETMLAGLLDAGFAITGTWPVRTERGNRPRAVGWNALASSIVLVCRPREIDAALATRREFVAALRGELPDALRHMQQGNIAPVDLAQASIGPGMAVFSRYTKVLEANGQPMRVRSALELINQVLDEVLAEQEGEFDADTRWAVAWFSQFGTASADYGVAETLSKAKNTAVAGLVEAGIAEARAGKVRLLGREELDGDWDPATDTRVTIWEVTQHLIQALDSSGEQAAAALLRRVGGLGDAARDLAYRLYSLCERKGWAAEALGYNGLVTAWPEIARLAAREDGPEELTFDT